uniref:Coiled-coil domain containing 116 n=1 Tax=Otolemur garnettii TaxID=30611 RepID=H0XCC2_OTOGA
MANCRHHSGYLADDEGGHSTYVARVPPPKKSVFLDMGPTFKLGHEPHSPSTYASSVLRCHRQKRTAPQPFGSFLDFLTEGQVLESLQTVVEEAAERMAAMKTEAGLPLVEVQDPMEMPSVRHRVHARPNLKTVRRHRAQPSLCVGRPNNYPSCSSSMSDSHSSLMAGCLDSHSRDSDLGAHGLGPLPPMRDKLLLEKNLKRLLRLENKGKGLSQSCSRRDSLPWDSLDSQTSSLGNREQPLSWFSGLLGSSSDIPEASDLGPGEQELIFLRREFNKELKSRLSQLSSFNLPGYCSLREPHHTLDFLAKHQLFPALQSVVSQAVDKLSGAYRRDGCPLFPANFQGTSELPSDFIEPPLAGRRSSPNSKEEPCNSLHTTVSSPKMTSKKTKGKQVTPSVLSAPVTTRFRFKETPTEESNVPGSSFRPRQKACNSDPKLQKLPVSQSSSQRARPWRGLHLTLPGPGVVVELASSHSHLRGPIPPPHSSYHPRFPYNLSPLNSFMRNFSSPPSSCPEVTLSRTGLGVVGINSWEKGSFRHLF